MKSFFLFYIAAFLPLIASGQPLEAEQYHVYGKIVDADTGEPITHVTVQLLSNDMILASMKADQGNYGFYVLTTGKYDIEVLKNNEYNDFSYRSIVIKTDDQIRRDIALQKPIQMLQLRQNGKEVDILDIGEIKNTDTYIVELFNPTDQTWRFSTGKNRHWIVSVSPESAEIEPDATIPIAIKVDPLKLEAGQTSGKVVIISDNGNRILTIKAVGEYPTIQMLAPKKTLPTTFEAQITFSKDRNHTYINKGFCFSSTNERPTIDDFRISANDFSGKFVYNYDSEIRLPWFASFEWGVKWYVRAYLRYDTETGNDVIIYSENVEDFMG